MNNNKKYKKWSLGLVAPALVLAPIAVVASCSSSTEEKEAYGVTFTNNNEIRATIHKAVQPNALTKDQFKEEVLAHKSDLFTIEGTLPSESFLNDNIEIGDLNASDDAKTVSTNVKLNKANTSGESIEKTITLKGLGYQEVDLNGKTYTIAFKQGSLEITLDDQGTNLVESLTSEQLMKLVIDKKDEILTIEGDDADKITNDVLENQILEISNPEPNKTEGKITFTLSVKKPVNGEGQTLEKTITFKGFKQEANPVQPQETVAKTEISTVTLGLNGSKTEVQKDQEVNKPEWILERTRLLFDSGFELIKDAADITNITWEEINDATSIYIKFDIAANKWIQNDGTPGNNTKAIKIKIIGLSSADTANQTLSLKSTATDSNPLSIALIDPALGEGTYEAFKNDSAKIFTEEFVFKYRKHLLTGDFTKVDAAGKDAFLAKYPADTAAGTEERFVKISPDDSKQTIQIQFKILGDKLEGTTSDTEFTIVFNGFATK